MRFLYKFLFLYSVHFLNAQNYTVSYQLVHHYSMTEINGILNSFGVPSFLLQPVYEVDYYKVVYHTTDALGTGTTIASGAIAVPSGVSCPLPIFSYQHGTTTLKNSVPSNRLGDEFKVGLLGCSSKGSVVTMPDYLGLGSSPGFHPYINSRTEASATIDLLRTCRELQDSIGYNLNGQLMLFGYSQGAHSTMATFKEIETNLSSEFTVTACAPMSGPYNVSGVQAQSIIADTTYATPCYLPYVVMGQQAAYGNLYNSLSDVFKAPYDSLLPIWFNGTRSTSYINNRLPDTPNVILDSAYFNDFKNNPNHFFRDILKDQDLHNWRPTAPLNMYYCTQDEQVFYQNSLVARDSMHALGATQVNAINVGAYTHSGCAQLCFIQGLFFFNSLGDWSGGIQVSDSVSYVSASGQTDGSIHLNVSNAVGAVYYDWSNALPFDSTSYQYGIGTGNYNIRVSDSRGCYTTHSVNLGVTAVNEISETDFEILPNPATEFVTVRLSDNFDNGEVFYEIKDIQGKGMYKGLFQNKQQTIDVSGFSPGVYLLTIESGNLKSTQRIIKQ
jgi:hypothetical protein